MEGGEDKAALVGAAAMEEAAEEVVGEAMPMILVDQSTVVPVEMVETAVTAGEVEMAETVELVVMGET